MEVGWENSSISRVLVAKNEGLILILKTYTKNNLGLVAGSHKLSSGEAETGRYSGLSGQLT